MANILVVDDEVGIRELLSEILMDEGYGVRVAHNAQAARESRARERPDLVLLDIWMPDTDGISLLKEWAAGGLLTMPVVMMSGHASIDSAVEATRVGALGFLEKPIALQKLLTTVKRALASRDHRAPQGLTLAHLGRSQPINNLRRRLQQVAAVNASVLLRGEAGTLGEIYARALQQPGTPFISATAALTEPPQDALQRLQRAAGGILFVDDLSQLSRTQAKGLAFILSRLDRQAVRIVSYSSANPQAMVHDGVLDASVLPRLNEIVVPLPTLTEQAEDIPDIASVVLAQLIESKVTPPRRFSTAALNALRNFNWPRNLEQLQQVVKSVAVLALEEEIGAAEVETVLRSLAQPAPPPMIDFDAPLREARDAFERAYFEHLLLREQGSISRVAEASGMERTHLYRKLKQLGVATGKKDET